MFLAVFKALSVNSPPLPYCKSSIENITCGVRIRCSLRAFYVFRIPGDSQQDVSIKVRYLRKELQESFKKMFKAQSQNNRLELFKSGYLHERQLEIRQAEQTEAQVMVAPELLEVLDSFFQESFES
jgi:hypothetical protein